ncbi:IclR family transcriptional regulator [Streptomonospora litoralis]|uniref:HTH-type transcriptional repressor AllR n=1 Tax=Streptomonospora litoralis TaxID=2498135 RepID=A0A4P6PY03_9ACTN|nr:IclR family transcriptional regulator [Streptomonospora litoralis]QBI53025.1 HTH-type transcriptional repressor AllR [Streptomonospora litoralis]
MVTEHGGGNQSVERASAVMRAFLHGRAELRVSDISRLTGIGQSTVSRLLATLESAGLISKDEASGFFRLGLDHVSLAGVVLNNHPVHREARGVSQRLAAKTGLGVNVAVRDAATLFYLSNFEGEHAAKSHVLMGNRYPLHATALGKCLLAATTAEERRTLLGEPLPSYTTATVTDHARLDAAVKEAATRGYTTEIEELALGRACIAAPVRDYSGGIAAAMSLSGPLSAMNVESRESELARVVIEAADRVSLALGYQAHVMV